VTNLSNQNENSKLKGRQHAAILINILPPELRNTIMQRLSKDEKLDLGKTMKEGMDFTEAQTKEVLVQYIAYMKESTLGVSGGQEYIYNLFKDSMSQPELEDLMQRLFSNESTPFESIKDMADIKPLLTILQKEDPQTIAIVSSFLKPTQAAQLLQALPPEKMSKVAFAIAQLDQPNQDVLLELESEINKMLDLFVSDEQGHTDGIKTLVDIINNVPRSTEKVIFSYLDEVDKDLSEEVRDRLFMFEDIATLEVRDVMTIVNQITEDIVIAKAMRAAPEEIKVLFHNAMSEGRRERVLDADSVIGKIKLQEAEEAQQEISNIAKQLEKDGKITVPRGEDDVIL